MAVVHAVADAELGHAVHPSRLPPGARTEHAQDHRQQHEPDQQGVDGLKAQLEKVTAELAGAQKKLKSAEQAAGRQATWNNLATYFNMFGRMGVQTDDIAKSAGIDKAMNQGMAFVLEKLIGQFLFDKAAQQGGAAK